MHRSAVLALSLLLTPLAVMAEEPRQPKLSPTAVQWNGGIAYGYDGTGNVIRIGGDVHVYDGAGRLVLSDTDGIRRTYSYDGFGNRTSCVQTGPSDCQFGRTITGANVARNRMDGYSYDPAGNVTGGDGVVYSYDALNMQTRSTNGVTTAEYVYTADDERIAIYGVTTGSWNWTLRDASAKVLREFTSRNGTGNGSLGTASWTWTKEYFWRDNLLLATRQTEPGASTPVTYHYHLDHLGTPRRITNDANQIVGEHNYHPFGPETSGSTTEPSPTRLKYTGHERDGELDYMHARYYDPKLGRFLSLDPILGNPQRPQSWNRYSYVQNNPVNANDPSGMKMVCVARVDGPLECTVIPDHTSPPAPPLPEPPPTLFATFGFPRIERWYQDNVNRPTDHAFARLAAWPTGVSAEECHAAGLCHTLSESLDQFGPLVGGQGKMTGKLAMQLGKAAVKNGGRAGSMGLRRLAQSLGFVIKDGGAHLRVETARGELVTVIPHTLHGTGTGMKIVKDLLAAAGL